MNLPGFDFRLENRRPVLRGPRDPTQHGMSVPDVAGAFRVSNSAEFLAETAPITAEVALRIGKFCSNRMELWLRMQLTCHRRHACQEMACTLDHIPT
jgi:antitoxin HigA-1